MELHEMLTGEASTSFFPSLYFTGRGAFWLLYATLKGADPCLPVANFVIKITSSLVRTLVSNTICPPHNETTIHEKGRLCPNSIRLAMFSCRGGLQRLAATMQSLQPNRKHEVLLA
jgi:hypothetical protein